MRKLLFTIFASCLAICSLVAVPAKATTTGLLDGALSYSGYVGQQFNGSYCATPNVCEVIPGYQNFPIQQNISQGVTALESWLPTHPGSIVLGTSEGAQVVYRYGRENPTSTQVFIVTGNPERKYGGTFYGMSGSTPTGGQITDVAIQYDFFADFPNNPSSPYYGLALLNVLVGGILTHIVGYNTANLNDPSNVTWTEGNITYVLIPHQPSLLWVSQAQIEDAYIRPTGPVIYGQTTTTTTTTPVATATVAPEVTSNVVQTTTTSDPVSLATVQNTSTTTTEKSISVRSKKWQGSVKQSSVAVRGSKPSLSQPAVAKKVQLSQQQSDVKSTATKSSHNLPLKAASAKVKVSNGKFK